MADSTIWLIEKGQEMAGRERHKLKKHTNTTITVLFFPLNLALSVECLPVEDRKIQRKDQGWRIPRNVGRN
jgi:hypothetical protein